jgi:hypothetical protein
MKTTLTFEVDDAKEDGGSLPDLQKLMKADGLFAAVWDFDSYLRDKIKYGGLPKGPAAAYEDARKRLHDELTDHGINLEQDYL